MDFFVGAMKVGVDHEEVYQQIKRKLLGLGFQPNDERIYMICHEHNGNTIVEKVGDISPSSHDTVIAIFNTQTGYIVVTPSQGYVEGAPYLVGTVRDIRYFG